jgi:hypothetical protein
MLIVGWSRANAFSFFWGGDEIFVHFVEQFISCLRVNTLCFHYKDQSVNPLSPELNPMCYLLALVAHDFLHVSRIRVRSLTLRLLMSYIHMEHLFLMFLDHTQRRSTVGRTTLDE